MKVREKYYNNFVRRNVLCSWVRHLMITVPLSTQEYKWVPANCQGNLTKFWEVTCNGLASHPGGVAILHSLYATETGISSGGTYKPGM